MMATDRTIAAALYKQLSTVDESIVVSAFQEFVRVYGIENRLSAILEALRRIIEQNKKTTTVTVASDSHIVIFNNEFINKVIGISPDKINHTVESSIIGGCQIRTDHTIWDYSAETVLDTLRTTLVTSHSQ